MANSIFMGERGLILKNRLFTLVRKKSLEPKITEGMLIEEAQNLLNTYINDFLFDEAETSLCDFGDIFE